MRKTGKYCSTKTFGANLGLSCAFRQWKAESHCRFVHGYALEIKLIFSADELDVRNWVVDFGGLKSLKTMFENTFDHKLIVAEDDPLLVAFHHLHNMGACDLVVVPAGGCEKFAEMVYEVTAQWLKDAGYGERCWLLSAEVREHGANSAIYLGDKS